MHALLSEHSHKHDTRISVCRNIRICQLTELAKYPSQQVMQVSKLLGTEN